MSYAPHGVHWLEALDAELREAFAGGVRDSRSLHDSCGLGKSRHQTFDLDDRDEAEEFLSVTGAAWEGEADGVLRVAQDRPATKRRLVTGAEVWLNQVDQWHQAGPGDETARPLAEVAVAMTGLHDLTAH
ncbi:hypothetical protein ACWGJB_34475 [Streptomyces sp. NPDC054813]